MVGGLDMRIMCSARLSVKGMCNVSSAKKEGSRVEGRGFGGGELCVTAAPNSRNTLGLALCEHGVLGSNPRARRTWI